MSLRQPIWPRFLPTATVVSLATLGPLGRRLPAPGTWGSAAGLLYFAVVFLRVGDDMGPIGMAIFILAVTAALGYLAVALCGEAEFRLAKKDPGCVILDECIAMPLVFLGAPGLLECLPPGWHDGRFDWSRVAVVAAGFLLFRFFDVLKPLGIRRLQALPGGWGIVADDVAAALAACAVLNLARLAL
ncbi:MAG TPA: phosphatidylglycerophosphatase A [Opitutaceae bacterium]|jgi:phosphatidylglycerophosphatase A|nr:phosphatidylglycerophosphatase A [Opitutaceae bacterium]